LSEGKRARGGPVSQEKGGGQRREIPNIAHKELSQKTAWFSERTEQGERKKKDRKRGRETAAPSRGGKKAVNFKRGRSGIEIRSPSPAGERREGLYW